MKKRKEKGSYIIIQAFLGYAKGMGFIVPKILSSMFFTLISVMIAAC